LQTVNELYNRDKRDNSGADQLNSGGAVLARCSLKDVNFIRLYKYQVIY
jgi:hypothetical protein